MKTHLAAAMISVLMLTQTVMGQAQSAGHTELQGRAVHTKMAAAPMYVCLICHHKASATLAKRVHYVCPVDGGKLVLVKPAKK